MGHLDDITLRELHDALERVEGKKPTQRVLAAIAYKRGISQTELAEWHNVQRKTIYSWLCRLDPDSIAQSATDAYRPGRPRKLSPDQQRRLKRTLRVPPTDVGLDAQTWTPTLVQTHLQAEFGVEYSLPSCRRLMREAGLSYQELHRSVTGGTDESRDGVPSKTSRIWR